MSLRLLDTRERAGGSPLARTHATWSACLCAAMTVDGLLFLARAAQHAFGSELSALAATVNDDSYYYLLPAFRFHQHGTWTFDGLHSTFAVQPIYAWFLTALAGLFDDRFAFFRTALWVSYLCVAVTAAGIAAVVFQLLCPAGARRAWLGAALGFHAFLASTNLVHGYTTLKENGLYGVLLVASLLVALRARRAPGPWTWVGLGLLCGLCVSCRIMPSTLLVALAIGLFAAGGLRLRPLGAMAGGALAAVVPWVLHATLAFGRVLPTSGAVKSAWLAEELRAGRLWTDLPELASHVGPYLADVFAYAFGWPSAFGLPQGRVDPNLLTRLLPFFLLGLLLVGFQRHVLHALPETRIVPLALALAILGTALNPLLLGLERMDELRRYSSWYIAALPVLLAMLLPLAVSFVGPVAWLTRFERWSGACAAALALVFLAVELQATAPLHALEHLHEDPASWNTQMVALAARANAALPATARIAAYNSGVLGFLSHSTVVNMDGLANDDVLAARAHGTTDLEYLADNEVGYVADPLRPRGWFGNAFDRLRLVAAVPFRLEGPDESRAYYDGYPLLAITEERFPSFEPERLGPGVRVEPWLAADPLGADGPALRAIRLEPLHGPASIVFHTQRAYEALRLRLGAEPRADPRAPVRLVVQDETGVERYAAIPELPHPVVVPCRDADWIRVEASSEGTLEPAVIWLIGLSFEPEAPEPRAPTFARYGEGSAPAPEALPPRLTVEGEARPGGLLRFTCSQAPPGAQGLLAIDAAPAFAQLEGGARGLVERTRNTVLLPLEIGPDGHAELVVPVPADRASGPVCAQVVFREGRGSLRFFAATNGVRIRLHD